MTRRPALVILVALCATLQFGVAWQVGVAGAEDTPSTTTAPSTTVPETTTLAPTTVPAVTTPPVTGPSVTNPAITPLPGTPAPPVTAPVESTTSTTTTPATTVPPASVSEAAAQAYVNSLARSGASSTGPLLDALKALETIGFSHEEAVKVGFGHFPVGGPASFREDFGDFRAGPPVHTHEGNDIFAAFNTPVRAPFDGVVRQSSDPLGGIAVYLTQPDGTFYYICHLTGYPPDVASGSAVTQGTVIGLVGDTGDAKGGSPHAHFEIHPKGGAAIDPKPVLDGWLAEALAAVPDLVGASVVDQPAVIQSTGLTRRFDLTGGDKRVPAPVEPLLWASSVSPAGSAVRLAQAEAAKMADSVDWDRLAAEAQRSAASQLPADGVAGIAARPPLTPPTLPATPGDAHP